MARVTRSSSRKSTEEPPAKAAPAITKTKPTKKPATAKKAAAAKPESSPAAADESSPIASSTISEAVSEKIVTVEACKSWGAFRTRSDKIVKGVGSRAKVEVNKEKPGKGNFVVTVSGVDKPIVELRAMSRPFPALKALDMEEVLQNIISALEQGGEEKE